MYIAKYLPVDKPFTDGCMAIDRNGEVFEWNASAILADIFKTTCKVAELFIVTYEYNELKIVGKPCIEDGKWVKEDMLFHPYTVSKFEVFNFNDPAAVFLQISCPVCGH